jgi:anti-sigma-K factor RskA
MSRSTRPHDVIEELIAAGVLDGLDDREERELGIELASHGADCPDCAELLSGYHDVAAQLALSLDPASTSAGAEERLLAAARLTAAEPVPTPSAPSQDAWGPPRPRAVVARRWVAAAVAAAIVVVAGAAGYLAAPETGDLRVAALEPQAGQTGQQLAVAFQPGSERAFVVGDLPGLPEGQVYELWFRRPGSATMEPAGVFLPRDGRVVAEVTVGERIDLLAVTVERGFQPQPTSDPIFAATVQ